MSMGPGADCGAQGQGAWRSCPELELLSSPVRLRIDTGAPWPVWLLQGGKTQAKPSSAKGSLSPGSLDLRQRQRAGGIGADFVQPK
jgi:hypothetical protein